MREFKFRGWCSENKTMIYSSNFDLFFGYADGTIDHIMQYTGLKDKNGKEIYEGDIIITDGDGPYEVKWFNCLAWDGGGSCVVGFYLSGQYIDDGDLEYHTRLSIDSKYLKVLGNIYENPELLELKNASN